MTVGSAGTFAATATGYPVPTFNLAGDLPTGVTFDSASGVLSGTPASGSKASYPLMLNVINGITPSGVQPFTLTVTQAPAITSADSVTFQTGLASTFAVIASGLPVPHLTEVGSLPVGLSFDATTGILSGTPQPGSSGTYALTFAATNNTDVGVATQSFTLTVNASPAITSGNSTSMTVGTQGTFTVQASGAPAPLLGLTGGLPKGVSFDPLTAHPQWYPGEWHRWALCAECHREQRRFHLDAAQPFTLTVDEAPAITSADRITLGLGLPSTFSVTATGYPALTLSEAGALLAGMTFDASTGILSGTPTTDGFYPLTFKAVNGTAPDART